ncbi:MAG TPA: hypothetical protein VGK59_14995 [Ohtaekwangia sp.]
MFKSLVIILGLILLVSCDEEPVESRSFLMGFTQDDKLVSEPTGGWNKSDIVHFHFDDPLSLVKSEQRSETGEIAVKKQLLLENTTLYLSASPINAAWSGPKILSPGKFSFKTAEVKEAYLDYCVNLIDSFEPSYFNMADKANLLFLHNPSAWSDFLDFHSFVYTQLKSRYPKLIIFSSIAAEPIIEKELSQDRSLQRLAALQLLFNSDLFGITLESKTFNALTYANAKKPFEELFRINAKPLGIEISYDGKESAASNFNSSLLLSCHSRRAVFLVSQLPYEKLSFYHTQEVWDTYFQLPYKAVE